MDRIKNFLEQTSCTPASESVIKKMMDKFKEGNQLKQQRAESDKQYAAHKASMGNKYPAEMRKEIAQVAIDAANKRHSQLPANIKSAIQVPNSISNIVIGNFIKGREIFFIIVQCDAENAFKAANKGKSSAYDDFIDTIWSEDNNPFEKACLSIADAATKAIEKRFGISVETGSIGEWDSLCIDISLK